jgi:PilZ domain
MAQVPRAERFPIVTPVLWRPRLQDDWSKGTSVNASRSGLLFQTDQPPAVGTEVEVIIALSWEPDVAEHADVKCSGHIARIDEGHPGGPAAASTIDSYSFLSTLQRQGPLFFKSLLLWLFAS